MERSWQPEILEASPTVDSEQWKPRPVFARFLSRMAWEWLDPPTDRERQDAIAVMRECYPPILQIDELLLLEAQRILEESDETGIFTAP